MKKIIYVVLNSCAGQVSEQLADEVLRSFSRYPEVTCEIRACDPASISAAISKAIDAGGEIICSAGGDGTVSTVANNLINKNASLGILPLGTLNHLAKDLGIPLDLDQSVDVICSGKTARIDVGEVNGVYFVNNVSIGIYPKIVQLRDRLQSYLGKWPAMIIASIVVLTRIAWFRVQVEWNNHMVHRMVPLSFIGNNRYETSWPDTGTRKSLNEGILWLMIASSKGVWQKLRAVILALAGKPDKAQELEIFEIPSLIIRTFRGNVTVGVDGETVKLRSPLIFRSHPAALKVRVPADF